MTIYTVVDEGYDVTIYRSLKKLVQFLCDENVCAVGEDGAYLTTWDALQFEVETCRIARFYAPDAREWKYRAERHT